MIAGMVPVGTLSELVETARRLEMFVLVEAFSAADLEDVSALLDEYPDSRAWLLVGVNCRNLRTLDVDPARFESLAASLPAGPVAVAESGIGGPEDAADVARLGYSMALVGTALMRSGDPAGAARAMIDAGRAEAASCV